VHTPLRRLGPYDPTGRPSPAALVGSLALHAGVLAIVAALSREGPHPAERHASSAEAVEYFDLAFPEERVAIRTGEAMMPAVPSAPVRARLPAGSHPERRDRPDAPPGTLAFPSGVPSGPPLAAPAKPSAGTAGTAETGAAWSPLRPGIRDPRLFSTERPAPAEGFRARDETGLRRVPASIAQYNDSVAAEAAGERRRMDWTQTDDTGRRWGIAPGRIYLGRDTLLLRSRNSTRATFSGSPQAREEAGREARERAQIDRQVEDGERGAGMRERVRATRERKDAERRPIRGET
jgi:hypothetical protein